MADQFCPHCGTEVDADARFCPTCGQTLTIEAEEEEASPGVEHAAPEKADEPTLEGRSQIPPAPAWPPPEPEQAVVPEPPASAEPAEVPEERDEAEEWEPGGQPAPPPQPTPAPQPMPAPAPEPGTGPRRGGDELPITMPTMLSGWLIGAGSGLAALALLPILASVLNVVLFLGLLWVTATVFLADRMPQFAQQRLATLAVVMIALGVALDRAAFRVSGVDSIFLIMTLVATGGVLLLELGRDRPMPPPGGSA